MAVMKLVSLLPSAHANVHIIVLDHVITIYTGTFVFRVLIYHCDKRKPF